MRQTTVNVRVDEDVKRGMEEFCGSVGMNVSTAVNLFFKAVLYQRKIPFEIIMPEPQISKSLEEMTKQELDTQIQAGLDDIDAGRMRPVEEVFRDLERKYGM